MTILVALGSNRRHGRYGAPERVLRKALAAIEARGITVERASTVWRTKALGPGGRNYANMVIAVRTPLGPEALLGELHDLEAAFGRRRWRRWGARVLDLDLLAYGQKVRRSQRRWPAGTELRLPHPQMHRRAFVLDPAAEIAPRWRHPILRLTVRQMQARLRTGRRIDPPRRRA